MVASGHVFHTPMATPLDENGEIVSSNGWDPEQGKLLARDVFGAIDCTSAANGIERAFESRGWRLTGYRLWWEPNYTPNSYVNLVVTAEWKGPKKPAAPWINAVVLDADGRLDNVSDVSPWDEYDLPRKVPKEIEYTATIPLSLSGERSVFSRIDFKAKKGPARAKPSPNVFDDDEDVFIEDEQL
jgi:hypothetical protein